MFTDCKNNRFRKKLMMQNTNIWISPPPPIMDLLPPVVNTTWSQISLLRKYFQDSKKWLQFQLRIIPVTIIYNFNQYKTRLASYKCFWKWTIHINPAYQKKYRIVNKQKGQSSGNLWSLCSHTCRITHLSMQVLASQLLFLANRNAGQAIPPLC